MKHEGDNKSLYGFLVVTGRLAMIKTSTSGKELVVELLPAKDIFGLLLTLSHRELSEQLSARAQTVSKVMWVPIRNLTPMLHAHPFLYEQFVAHLLDSLQSSYRISRGLAHDRVEVRIATVLSILVNKFAKVHSSPQDHTIDVTRQQLADLTGTTVETAIRVTRAMQRDGVIDIKKPGIIHVLSSPKLQKMSEGE
jgi:CRP-like cAMP-binding protein